MKLYRVILPVLEIKLAVDFYRYLFKSEGTRVSEGRHYFNLGGTILVIYDPKADGDDDMPHWKPHFNQYIYVSVANLEGIFHIIQRQQTITGLTEIEVMPWGERLFYFNDPWGNPMCFVDEATVFKGF